MDHATNAHDRKCILIINRMSMVLTLLMLMFASMSPILHISQLRYFTLPFCVAFAITPFLNYKGWLTFSKYYLTFMPVICLVFVCFFNSIQMGDRFFLLTTATIPIILFRKKATIYGLFYISVAAFIFTSWYQSTHEPIIKLPQQLQEIYWYFTIVSVFAVLFYVVMYFRQGGEDYEKELEEKNKVISIKNKEIIDSINYAQRIQKTLLPSEKAIEKALKKHNEN